MPPYSSDSDYESESGSDYFGEDDFLFEGNDVDDETNQGLKSVTNQTHSDRSLPLETKRGSIHLWQG